VTNVTNQQLNNATSEKDTVAAQVGTLTAQVASLQNQVLELNGKKEMAEQKLALAQAQLDAANAKADAAKAAVAGAKQGVQTAQKDFVRYAQAVYMNGTVTGTTGTLLTARDPSTLLDQVALQQYQTSHQITAIGELQKATVAKSNADAASRKAVLEQKIAKSNAVKARDAALAALQDAQTQQAGVQQQQAQAQTSLDSAQYKLAGLTNQRAKYTTWHNNQIVLANQAAQAQQDARQAQQAARTAAAKRRQAMSDLQLAQQELAEQKAALSQSQSDNSGGSSNSAPSAPVAVGGSWTSGKAQQAVSRAKRWLGEDYIWAGGNGSGPTTGGCTDPIARCGTLGFDCSGLVLYAWAPYISMAHYAATQYTQAGSYHPSSNNFQPGDLLFWSYDGTISGIHHVAMYIGGGMVIQAPESGDVVRETPWYQVSGGYFGATRPLT
jgi:cell wall-associated NlpC family hydrolase